MFCENCGRQIGDGDSHCPHCNSPVGSDGLAGAVGAAHTAFKTILGQITNPSGDAPGAATDFAGQTPSGFVLSADEFMIRKYLCAQVLWPRSSGHLSVTNRRVLFHAFRNGIFSNSRTVIEVPLDSVSGITTFYGGRFSCLRFCIGIALIVMSFGAFAVVGDSEMVESIGAVIGGIILLLVGLLALWFSNGKTLFLKLYSSKALGSPLNMGHAPSRGFFEVLFGRLYEELFGGLFASLFGSREQFNLKLRPTKQTDRMMLELGALISDLQRMGDHGAERWK